MSLSDLLSKSRSFSIGAVIALGLGGGAMGCSSAAVEEQVDEEGVSVDDITQTTDTKVKRQSIGNCWLYAVASWVEAINKRATGTDLNTSESYWTYWHWFEQLANGRSSSEISTGGSYGTAAGLIDRYGIMVEKDFIADESEAEMSNRQSSALAAINESLKNGTLKDPAVRRDRAKVRAELDKAWKLSPDVVTKLNAVFGAGVTRTLDRSFASRQPGNGILRARDLPVASFNFATNQEEKLTLKDAIGTGSFTRQGAKAFHEENYPTSESGRRKFQIAVQQSLHAGVPVIVSWKVDFNALAPDAKFSLEELNKRGPGRQGGHMTVMTDYQVKLVDGKLLKAGENVTDPNLLKSALDPKATVEFFRVKNSWGAIRPDRWSDAAKPGYHELTIPYLNGPIKECVEKNGTSDPTNCPGTSNPWWDAVLPPGIGTNIF